MEGVSSSKIQQWIEETESVEIINEIRSEGYWLTWMEIYVELYYTEVGSKGNEGQI